WWWSPWDRDRSARRSKHPTPTATRLVVHHQGLAGRALLLVLEGVADVEWLVGDEQRRHVAVLGGAVLHEHAFREPHEAARTERSRVRLQGPVEHVDPVGAVVPVPWVGEPGFVLDHLDRHAGVGVVDERLERDAEVELIDVELPRTWRWSRSSAAGRARPRRSCASPPSSEE